MDLVAELFVRFRADDFLFAILPTTLTMADHKTAEYSSLMCSIAHSTMQHKCSPNSYRRVGNTFTRPRGGGKHATHHPLPDW